MVSDTCRTAIKQLFSQVLELDEAQREAFLSEVLVDEDTKNQVRLLLTSHIEDRFLEPPPQMRAVATEEWLDPFIGRMVASFQLVRRIGMGASGIVYEALQASPARRVAVKIFRSGRFGDPRLIQRFLHESEILGRLQHPGIVQIICSGTISVSWATQPWFAMEFLNGLRLDEWCVTQPPIQERISVLLELLDAVEYAHGQGIVHRDLKPANVFLTDGGQETEARHHRVKVLDFGIARADFVSSSDSSPTMTGEIIGTLNYMSPEQLAGNSSIADARSDVYAIGAIAYELLAGEPAFGTQGLSLNEQILLRQQTDPIPLGKVVASCRGDLEAIVSKALEFRPEDRYTRAVDFAQDIRRWQQGLPVVARRTSLLRRASKYVRRNYVAALGVAATFVAMSVGMWLYAQEAKRSQAAAKRSEYEASKAVAVNNFLTNDFLTNLLSAIPPHESNGLEVEELIDHAADKATIMFGDQPIILAAIQNEMGTVYYNCNCLEKAELYFSRSADAWRKHLGSDHTDTLKATANLGLVKFRLNKLQEAQSILEDTLARRKVVLGEFDSDTCTTMNNLAQVYRAAEKLDLAEALLSTAAERSIEQADLRTQLTLRGNLANLLRSMGKEFEQFQIDRGDYIKCQAYYGKQHVFTLGIGFEYSRTLYRRKQYDGVIDVLSPLVTFLYGTNKSNQSLFIQATRLLARSYECQNQMDEAIRVLYRAKQAVEESGQEMNIGDLDREISRIEISATRSTNSK
ncbi:MAG: serine/threonine protein kinase [Planctomycetales bacterium]|nr:serine/threonine protein kinase [Planctomycetales bacterium]